jgi:putative intracellular protease/amidase
LNQVLTALTAGGAQAKIVAPRLGYLRTKRGNNVKIHCSLLTASSVLFDAVYVPDGAEGIGSLKTDPAALEFVSEAYKHAKAIAASGAGTELLWNAQILNGAAAPYSKKNQAGSRDQAVVVAQGGALDKMVEGLLLPSQSIATGSGKKCSGRTCDREVGTADVRFGAEFYRVGKKWNQSLFSRTGFGLRG